MTTPPDLVSKKRRMSAHKSWAMTPNRTERTEAARRKSKTTLAYWEDQIRAEGAVREQDIPKAAKNALSAEMTRRSLKGVAARQKAAAE